MVETDDGYCLKHPSDGTAKVFVRQNDAFRISRRAAREADDSVVIRPRGNHLPQVTLDQWVNVNECYINVRGKSLAASYSRSMSH